MIIRKYGVGFSTSQETMKVTSYFVTDAQTKEEIDERPRVAVFPVSEGHYAELQDQRAQMYADYMNKVIEATETAYDHIVLMDALKK